MRNGIGRLCLLIALMPCAAFAKTGDRDQPMHSSQDHLAGYNAPNTVTTLTGHVVITQGSMTATGEIAHVYMDANSQVSHITLEGHPAHIQQLDDNNKLMTGQAPTLTYDNNTGEATLSPDGLVTHQDSGHAQADVLTYNSDTTHFTGSGNVRMTYLPQPKPGQSVPSPSTTAMQPLQP